MPNNEITSKESMELSKWALEGVNKAKKYNIDLDDLTACVKIAWNIAGLCDVVGWKTEQDEAQPPKIAMDDVISGEVQGRCHECKYYQGVHFIQGIAPCSFWDIGGVSWKDYCSRWEEYNAKE